MRDKPDKARDMLRQARRLPQASASPLIGMSDPARLADPLKALAALPPGMILILRPASALPDTLIRNCQRKARSKDQRLLLSSSAKGQTCLLADGRHLPERACYHRYRDSMSAAVHGEKALIAAARAGAQMVLISPVFATKSHMGGRTLGVARLAQLVTRARALGLMPYALGGITTCAHIRRLGDTGISGIAGISFLQA